MNYIARLILLFFMDSLIVAGSLYLSLMLRFDGFIPEQYMQAGIKLAPLLIFLSLASNYLFKIYNRLWAYASAGELLAILKATSAGTLLFVALIYTLDLPTLPRSVYLLVWVLNTGFIGISRIWWKVLRDTITNRDIKDKTRVLIIGAGNAGALLLKEINESPERGLLPIGFIDDDSNKQNSILRGIPVLGKRNRIIHIVEEYDIDEIIIAMPSVKGQTIRELVNICKQTKAKTRILPSMYQLSSKSAIKQIRNVNMEDLLRRDPLVIDLENVCRYITGKCVLVTGAGGSIGSELCRQLTNFSPAKLVLIDNSENNLFEIQIEMKAKNLEFPIISVLQDIRRHEQLEDIFDKYRPQVIFHAAAFKHVPMMEQHPDKAIENNVFGTKNVAMAADKFGAETFILISTDKAVNPTSVMGATKRMAEMIIQQLNRNSTTNFSAVRFGNVLGSRGSVIPTFIKQIEKGGPVTVTHPDMVRYFMTIPEAVQLVLQAGALARGGEVFVLDMGEPVKILDLACDLISLAGLEPYKDIPIQFVGIRPGEKLYEELLTGGEGISATLHNRIWIAADKEEQLVQVDKILANYQWNTLDNLQQIDLIKKIVPEYARQTKTQIG